MAMTRALQILLQFGRLYEYGSGTVCRHKGTNHSGSGNA
jgi:hypothetical protein